MKFFCGCLLIEAVLLVGLAVSGSWWSLPLALAAIAVGVGAAMERVS